ncbi:MAG: Kelch repeat-containing protein [Candidatus Binataceae bacterium]
MRARSWVLIPAFLAATIGSLLVRSENQLGRADPAPSPAVLISGGEDNSGNILDSAELYSPASQTFASAAGTIPTIIEQQTATLLNDGTVLLAGGAIDHIPTATASIYDPTTQGFTAVGPMTDPRFGHTATLLPDGTVLIAGGHVSGSGGLMSAEIYSPMTKSFTCVGGVNLNGIIRNCNDTMVEMREFGAAAPLSDGTALITGGFDPSVGISNSAEIYDPATASFTQTTGSMTDSREDQTATLLADGNGDVLIAGGQDQSGAELDTAELYNPATKSFGATAGVMHTSHGFHTATLLTDGSVLIAGGTGIFLDGVFEAFIAEADVYVPATGTFTETSNMLACTPKTPPK